MAGANAAPPLVISSSTLAARRIELRARRAGLMFVSSARPADERADGRKKSQWRRRLPAKQRVQQGNWLWHLPGRAARLRRPGLGFGLAGWRLAAGARSIVFRDDAVGGYTLLGGSSETPAAPLRGERRGEITGAVIRLPLRSERRTSKLNCSARKFKFKFHSNKRLLWDPRRRRRGRRGCCHCGRRCH